MLCRCVLNNGIAHGENHERMNTYATAQQRCNDPRRVLRCPMSATVIVIAIRLFKMANIAATVELA